MKIFHKAQAISLIIAAGLLWIPYGSHTVTMGISTGIIVINALIEFVN